MWNDVETDFTDIYSKSGNKIIPKSNFLNGIRSYAVASLEHLIGLLQQKNKNDDLIIYLSRAVITLIENGNKFYFRTIREIDSSFNLYDDVEELIGEIEIEFRNNILSEQEKVVLLELMSMNLAEYTFKSDNVKMDYAAMQTISELAYEVLKVGLQDFTFCLTMKVDTDGVLKKWKADIRDKKYDNIHVEWIAMDKIDHFNTIYETQYNGLSENSKLELASADAYRKEYIETEKTIGSYSMLVKQYCGVIEQELNSMIFLMDPTDGQKKHLMWDALKKYIKKNDIQLLNTPFDLSNMLYDLHYIRNLAMHGEIVSEDKFKVFEKYKDMQLFEHISWTKLELMGQTFSPTVDELISKF